MLFGMNKSKSSVLMVWRRDNLNDIFFLVLLHPYFIIICYYNNNVKVRKNVILTSRL